MLLGLIQYLDVVHLKVMSAEAVVGGSRYNIPALAR